ncbi:3-deoxy-D-manno-octulosonic acid kinase [Salinimonas marina]|uniref:3-deoxy-D-manno-octulosonic acid kinase n=1 Tax=Salinimonas marina TaxID=2785918 RepID=A0A7S9HCX7_9ALTE|nr:3-deoxy-D-manno-octulosonic acid kinase [Salinimonas marina]QPG05721.1 3-deoxy-D-manno-octulosonic acid kinase [Salinimonas marina]
MSIEHQKISMDHHTLVNTYFLYSADTSLFSEVCWRKKKAVIGQAKGRGTTLFVQNTPDSCWVLRHYRRGGLIGKILNDQFFYTGLAKTRPFQEMRLLNTMCEAGLKVPTPVAAHVARHGLIYRADLITQRIDTATDLHHHLTGQPLSDRLWQEVGRAVRKMHDLQVYHHDLNVRNLMLDAREEVWIIDFDRCYQRPGEQWKEQNLARLYRSLQKELSRCPRFFWHQDNFAALREGYQQR